jgi:hypothetical protein
MLSSSSSKDTANTGVFRELRRKTLETIVRYASSSSLGSESSALSSEDINPTDSFTSSESTSVGDAVDGENKKSSSVVSSLWRSSAAPEVRNFNASCVRFEEQEAALRHFYLEIDDMLHNTQVSRVLFFSFK